MFEATLQKASTLKKVIEAIKDLVTDGNIEVSETGMNLQAMDSSHVSLVSLVLHTDMFEHFRCDRNVTLGINLPNFAKILKCSGNDDSVLKAVWKSTSHFSAMTRPCWLRRAVRNRHRHAIEQASRRWRGGRRDPSTRRDDSARTRRKILISTQAQGPGRRRELRYCLRERGPGARLRVRAQVDGHRRRVARHPRPGLQHERRCGNHCPPDQDYNTNVKMSSAEFQRIVRDMTVLGDTCSIGCTKEGVKFSVSGDLGQGNITLRQTNSVDKEEEAVTIEMDEPVELNFALRYLGFFTKASPLCPRVTISMSPDVPIVVAYNVGGEKDTEGAGSLSFYLAPKIDDEQAARVASSSRRLGLLRLSLACVSRRWRVRGV